VSKALAKDRDERYQHADDLLADLRRERKALEYVKSGQVTAASPVPEKRRPSTSRLLRYAIAASAVVAVAVLMLIFNPLTYRSVSRGAWQAGRTRSR